MKEIARSALNKENVEELNWFEYNLAQFADPNELYKKLLEPNRRRVFE